MILHFRDQRRRAAQLRCVTEIAPNSPFWCVKIIKKPYTLQFSCWRKSYLVFCKHSLMSYLQAALSKGLCIYLGRWGEWADICGKGERAVFTSSFMRHANSKRGYYLKLAANSNKMVIIFLLPLIGNYDLFDSALIKTSTVDRSIRGGFRIFLLRRRRYTTKELPW